MSEHTIELFLLKCAVIEAGLRATLAEYNAERSGLLAVLDDETLEPFIKQFDLSIVKMPRISPGTTRFSTF
jgi:hypothetical protein